MSPRAYVSVLPLAFGHAVPQPEGVGWMKAALRRVAAVRPVPDLGRALRYYDLLACTATIGARTTCLDDYTHADWDRMRLHAAPPASDGQVAEREAPWYRSSLDRRMEVFAETALALARDAFADDAEAPDLLVQVSCTGYDSPTAVQLVAVEKGWTAGTRLLHLGHMGCYAAVPAVALAADALPAICHPKQALQPSGTASGTAASDGTTEGRAALFVIELCTLHHDPAATDVEEIVRQCLFADGAARVDLTTAPPPGRSLAHLGYAEVLLPGTDREMTWRVADAGFRMTLSRDVPRHIASNLGPAVGGFLGRHGLAVEDVACWAVHPGGPRVIESAAAALGLPEAAVRHSQRVLFERGNMSSVTLPYIWAAMLADDAVRPGDLVVSLAFGPGLTVAMNLMRMEERR